MILETQEILVPYQTKGKRDYKKELNWEHTKKPNRVKDRAERNLARAIVTRKKGKTAVKGKDVDHITPLSKGGTTTSNNLRVQSKAKNRSFKRKSNGSMK